MKRDKLFDSISWQLKYLSLAIHVDVVQTIKQKDSLLQVEFCLILMEFKLLT